MSNIVQLQRKNCFVIFLSLEGNGEFITLLAMLCHFTIAGGNKMNFEVPRHVGFFIDDIITPFSV